MTNDPFQFEDYQPRHDESSDTVRLPPLPSGVSEADLLDLVEGRVSPDERKRIESTIHAAEARTGGNGELSCLLRGMSADRRALATVARDFVPAEPSRELVAKVIARAERELRESASVVGTISEPETSFIPVSSVQPMRRENVFASFCSGAFARRVAVAAGVLMVVGIGVWGIVAIGSAIWPSALTTQNGGVAQHVPHIVEEDEPPTLAVIEPHAPIVRVSPEMERAGAVITLTADSPLVKKIEPTQSLALAEDGKLVLKIWALPGRGFEAALRCDALAGQPGAAKATPIARWGVGYDNPVELPAAYAALATPTFTGGGSVMPVPTQPAFAGDQLPGTAGSAPITPGNQTQGSGGGWGVRRVYLVEVEATPAALAAFLADMERIQGDTDLAAGTTTTTADEPKVLGVNYVELSSPLPTVLPISEPASASGGTAKRASRASDLFWWNAPAEQWARRVVVPVVIESVE